MLGNVNKMSNSLLADPGGPEGAMPPVITSEAASTNPNPKQIKQMQQAQ